MRNGINWPVFGPELITAIAETLLMVGVALAAAGVFGTALGVLLYVTRRGGLLANSVLFNVVNVVINIIRPIPFIIFITLMAPVTYALVRASFGTPAIIVPLAVAASVAFARIVEQNLVAIDPGVIEAARAMGASRWRIIWSLLVPEALGPLILGFTFMFVAIMDASAASALIAGGGLGELAIVQGYNRFNFAVIAVCVLTIVLIVQIGQFVGNRLARRALRH